MQFRNYIVRISLVGLVASSLFLTFLIWTSNQSLEQENYENPVVTDENNQLNNQNFARVFLPTQVVNAQNGQNYVLINQQNDLISSLIAMLKSWNLKLNQIQTLDDKSYLEKLNNQNYTQVVYTDSMSLNVFSDVIDKKKNYDKMMILCLIVSLFPKIWIIIFTLLMIKQKKFMRWNVGVMMHQDLIN